MTIIRSELNNLPDCVLLKIFKRCKSKVVIWRARLVCKRWYFLLADSELWRVSNLSNFKFNDVNLLRASVSYMPVKELKYLEIHRNLVSTDVLDIILEQAPDLQGLRLYGCTVTTEQTTFTQHRCQVSRQLKFIDVRKTRGNVSFMGNILSDSGKGLEVLGVSNSFAIATEVQGKMFLNFLPNLTILECSDCVWMHDYVISNLATHCPLLKSLNLRKCSNITGSNFHLLIARCTKLNTLILRGTSIRSEEITKPKWIHSNIVALDLANCYYLDDESLLKIVQDLAPRLKYLCCAITDELVSSITNMKLKLRTLELRRRYPINEELLVNFLSNCECIESLDVSLMPIDYELYQQVLPNLPNLRWISFAGHDILKTCDVLKLLSKNCWNLKQVGFNYYHAEPNAQQLHNAILDFLISSSNLQKIYIGGAYVKDVVESVKASITNNQLYEKIGVKFCETNEFKLPQTRYCVNTYAEYFAENILQTS